MKQGSFFHYFSAAGIPIKVHSKDKEILEAAFRWLGAFSEPVEEICDKAIRIGIYGFDEGQELPCPIPDDAKCLFKDSNVEYHAYRDRWLIGYPKFGRIILDLKKEKMLCMAYRDEILSSDWDFEEYMHPLSELLRKHRLYQYHSAAVCWEGKGLMIIGRKGRGKSTLSIDLLDNGFDFLSDDRCFLKEHDCGIEVTGFHEAVRFFPSNMEHIRPLRGVDNGGPGMKTQLYLDKYYPDRMVRRTNLHCIIFPYWSPETKSSLEPVSSGDMLKELLPSTMMCLDPEISSSHFEFNCMLAEKIPAARLFMGYDRDSWHRLVIDFIESMRK